MKHTYICSRWKLMMHLKDRGFVATMIKHSDKDKRFKKWFYQVEPGLKEAVYEFYEANGLDIPFGLRKVFEDVEDENIERDFEESTASSDLRG